MKKIVALCSLLVCLAVIITVFSACNGNKTDENTTNNTEESFVIPTAVNGDFLFSAEVGEDSVVIKNNGEEYQVLKYPENSGVPFDVSYAKAHAEFIDLNFDGQPDFYIATDTEGDTIYYFCWLYNATSKKFDFSVSLSGLTNISVDHDNQVIYSTSKVGENTKIVSYGWVNGQLAYKEVFEDVSDTIPVEVTQSASNNAIGNSTKPTKTESANDNPADDTKEQTTKTNSSDTDKTTKDNSAETEDNKTTTKKDKPLNTTTTAPVNKEIEVATGDIDDGWF